MDKTMKQLSTEVLRLDTRIDKVSDDLDKLDQKVDSINNDDINQRVNTIANSVDNNAGRINKLTDRVAALENDDKIAKEIADLSGSVDDLSNTNDKINNTLGDIAKELDDQGVRIKKLENQANETAQEITLRSSAKSATRSIESSEFEEIHQEIHEVALAVDNLDASLSPKVNVLQGNADELFRRTTELERETANICDDMEEMDQTIHQEMHLLALGLDNQGNTIEHWNDRILAQDTSINAIQNSTNNIRNEIDSSINPAITANTNRLDVLDASVSAVISDVSTGFARIDASIKELGYYEQNPEFINVTLDSSNKILYGVQNDGNFYFGGGVPSQIKNYVLEIVNKAIENLNN